MRIADDPGDTRKLRQFLRRALGVTTGDEDTRGGVGGMQPLNGVASLGIGGGRDGAGVHDHDIGGGGFRRGCAAALQQLALESGAVSLGGAAAELFNVEGRHLSFSAARNNTQNRPHKVHREGKSKNA